MLLHLKRVRLVAEPMYLTCPRHSGMLMRTEYESVWTDKETEETLCAWEVEVEVREVKQLEAIVYCDNHGGGFPITGGDHDKSDAQIVT